MASGLEREIGFGRRRVERQYAGAYYYFGTGEVMPAATKPKETRTDMSRAVCRAKLENELAAKTLLQKLLHGADDAVTKLIKKQNAN